MCDFLPFIVATSYPYTTRFNESIPCAISEGTGGTGSQRDEEVDVCWKWEVFEDHPVEFFEDGGGGHCLVGFYHLQAQLENSFFFGVRDYCWTHVTCWLSPSQFCAEDLGMCIQDCEFVDGNLGIAVF